MSVAEVCSDVAKQHLRLHLAEGVGSITFSRLMERFGSAEAVLRASRGALMAVEGVGEKTAAAISEAARSGAYEAELLAATELGVRILCREDEDYPRPLQFIADPPICLYVLGQIKREDALSVAIAGQSHVHPMMSLSRKS